MVQLNVIRAIVLIFALVFQSFPGWMTPICTLQCPMTAANTGAASTQLMSCCAGGDHQEQQVPAACPCCDGSPVDSDHAPSPARDHQDEQDHSLLVAFAIGLPACPAACCSVDPADVQTSPAAALIRSAGIVPVAIIELPRPVYEPPDFLEGSFIRSAMRDGSPPREPERYRALLNIWTI